MAHVNITKDLTEVKSKVVFGLTRRQLIFFVLAALVAAPTYFLTRDSLGNDIALILLIVTALPFFFFALYEKNGQPPEKQLKNYICVRFLTRHERPYRTQNRFAALERQAYFDEEVKWLASNTETSQEGAKKDGRVERRTGDPARHAPDTGAEKTTGKGHQTGKARR